MRPILLMTAALALAGCERSEPVGNGGAKAPGPSAAKTERAITASFDCDRAMGQAQELICGDPNLAAMDREIARLSALAMEPAAQAEWVQQREGCDKADELRHCVMAAAMLKIHRLRHGSEAARARDGLSVGPVAYRCTGLDAPLLATFVNSDPGAVALEWGGQAIAIDRAAAASGARYDGRWDGEAYGFWSKGKEATLTIPGNGDFQCVETAAAV